MARVRCTLLLTPIESDALCLITAQTAESLSGAIRSLIRDGLRLRAYANPPDVVALRALKRMEGRNGELA